MGRYRITRRIDARPDQVYRAFTADIGQGEEVVRAFGGGQYDNERSQFGQVLISVAAARSLQTERTALELLSDAMAVYRSERIAVGATGDLTFLSDNSGTGGAVLEEGNWFVRRTYQVFEYRFRG